jgi:hypothetical protein
MYEYQGRSNHIATTRKAYGPRIPSHQITFSYYVNAFLYSAEFQRVQEEKASHAQASTLPIVLFTQKFGCLQTKMGK